MRESPESVWVETYGTLRMWGSRFWRISSNFKLGKTPSTSYSSHVPERPMLRRISLMLGFQANIE